MFSLSSESLRTRACCYIYRKVMIYIDLFAGIFLTVSHWKTHLSVICIKKLFEPHIPSNNIYGGPICDKGFPGAARGKEPACQCRRCKRPVFGHKRPEFDPWIKEDPLEEGKATHYSILTWRDLIDRGAWWAMVHRSQSWIPLKRLSTPARICDKDATRMKYSSAAI